MSDYPNRNGGNGGNRRNRNRQPPAWPASGRPSSQPVKVVVKGRNAASFSAFRKFLSLISFGLLGQSKSKRAVLRPSAAQFFRPALHQ
jgi:hypothetical protein